MYIHATNSSNTPDNESIGINVNDIDVGDYSHLSGAFHIAAGELSNDRGLPIQRDTWSVVSVRYVDP